MCGIVKLYSVRGRKRKIVVELVDWETIAIYPRKGTETCESGSYGKDSIIAIYPRKGTETPSRGQRFRTYPIATYPREGTKTGQQVSGFRLVRSYCNLSPQGDENKFSKRSCASRSNYSLSSRGDGNIVGLKKFRLLLLLRFSPVRGRKPAVEKCHHNQRTGLQFIPARGRKLCRVDCLAVVVHDCNLSPQGDENDHLPGFLPCLHKLQLIPARGQKSTSATGVCQQRRCFAFSYILFYRLGAAPAGIVFVTGSALTPCGTSGFMGRISCR